METLNWKSFKMSFGKYLGDTMDRDPYLVDLWRDMCGLSPLMLYNHPPLEVLKKTQWSEVFEMLMWAQYHLRSSKEPWSFEFITYMKNRLIMGSFRYGLMEEQDYNRFDLKKQILSKVQKFHATQNLECLVDAANNCMLEYIRTERLDKPSFIMSAVATSIMELYQYAKSKNCKFLAYDDIDHAKEIIK
jgi:hypothetical protein